MREARDHQGLSKEDPFKFIPFAAQPVLAETCPIHRIADQDEDRSFARLPAHDSELGLKVP